LDAEGHATSSGAVPEQIDGISASISSCEFSTLKKVGLLEIVWTNFQRVGVESLLAQGFAEFSKVQKLGMNWRWEERGGWWMCTASPDSVRGRLAREHPLTQAQPYMSFLRHQGIYCAAFQA
jgi:hypothetical protein